MTAIHRPCVCLVSSRHALAPDVRTSRAAVTALERWLAGAIDAGVDLIQIRESDLEAAALRALTTTVVRRAAGTSTQVVVNDRADVAIAAGAAGVHLRGDGPPVAAVRAWLGEGRLIGRSVHDPEEAGRAAGANYLLFGTVFDSRSKPGRPAAGLEALAQAVRQSPAPVLAIGGITPDRARACAAAGAAGVAAISLFLPPGRTPHSLGVAEATAQLRAALMTAGPRRTSQDFVGPP